MKKIHSYDDNSISLSDRHGVKKYDYPKRVFQPQSTQEDVYDEIITTNLMSSFFEKKNDVLLFAYGQTATGKTHLYLDQKNHYSNQRFIVSGVFSLVCVCLYLKK